MATSLARRAVPWTCRLPRRHPRMPVSPAAALMAASSFDTSPYFVASMIYTLCNICKYCFIVLNYVYMYFILKIQIKDTFMDIVIITKRDIKREKNMRFQQELYVMRPNENICMRRITKENTY